MSRAKVITAVLCVASFVTIGCSGTKATVSDAQITTEIQSKLYSDASTRQGNVAVSVKDGSVTLSGEVPNNDIELAAMKIANGVNGVRGVADQMKVTAAATPAPLPDNSLVSSAAKPTQLAEQRPRTTSPVVTAPPPAPVSQPDIANTAPQQTASAEPAPAPRAVEPARVTIPAGDRLSVRTIDAIDSGKISEGQAIRASLESPLVENGRVIVPAGAPVTLEVASVKSAGRIKGNSELSLRATSLQYRGRSFPITTSVYSDAGKARGKNTALKTGIGAGVGALIGGLAGGGKGAAIGAGAGGGAGFGYNALTHGQQIKIPSETVLNFQLQSSLTLPAPR